MKKETILYKIFKKIVCLAIVFSSIFAISSSSYVNKLEPAMQSDQQGKEAKFGFNVLWWEKMDSLKKQKVFSLLKQLEVDWVRIPFYWTYLEPQKGRLELAQQDKMIAEFSEKGINILLLVAGSPEWAVEDYVKASAMPPDDPDDYVAFLAKVAKRYKDKAVAWEIWNEPDNPPYWGRKKSTPQQYMDLLAPAYKAIKKADPGAIVAGACVLIQFLNEEPDYSYLQGLLELGLLNYCDAVSVHIYPEESPNAVNKFNKCLEAVEKMVREYGENEIWITEVSVFSKQFSRQKLVQLLMGKGLTPEQVKAMTEIPACRLVFAPITFKEMYYAKLQRKEEIERALSPFGLTFEDAFQISQQSLVDAREKQADFVEYLYEVSKKHRVFWFQLYDIAFSQGIMTEDFNPKLGYERLLSLNRDTESIQNKNSLPGIFLDNGPWPMYGHDPKHTWRSPYKGLTTQPLKPKWIFPSPGGIGGFTSSIAIGSNGKIYAGTAQNEDFIKDKASGYSGVLCAISSDGKKDWIHDSHRGAPMISMIESGPLLTFDGMIIYGKDDGHVYALNKKGELLWDFAADDPFNPQKADDNEQIISSSVLGPNNTLYILSHWGNVYSPMRVNSWVNKPYLKAIIEKWEIEGVKAQSWGKMYAVNARTGERKWVFDPSSDSPFNKKVFWGSPAVGDDGTIYAAAYDNSYKGYLYAMNPDGTLKWRYPKDDKEKIQALQSSPSIARDGTIYVGSFGAKDNARLYAFTPNGILKWSYEITENRITSGPGIGPDGTLYFGSHNQPAAIGSKRPPRGHLYTLRDLGTKAELKWKFEVKYGITASPAIDSEGNVFFSVASIIPVPDGILGDYHLYALNNKGEELWSYPFTGSAWGAPSIDKDGTIYIGIMKSEAGVCAFGLKKDK